MKIYTKTGDKGKTSLFGGERVWKDNLRIKAYGTVDEVNAYIGLALTEIRDEELTKTLNEIQNQLFVVGGDLAAPEDKGNSKNFKIPRVTEEYVTFAEQRIDFYTSKLPELKHFILPGGTKGASFLHVARTICRRAEREIITLSKEAEIGINVIIFLNRLSDLFFVLARYENFINETPDVGWFPNA